ncbi:hypothetical protein [Thalassobacillus devorans]|uniref:hypothetical protein n=1 Tax=Thalassobacillus devorans TaxID=279813 RepID=UPI00141BD4EC|nr:hypothetical protein [Thalassobacillus devorans]
MTKKLQGALDHLTKYECITITEQTYECAGFIDLGTGMRGSMKPAQHLVKRNHANL